MPYIKLEERAKFKPHIEQVISVLVSENDSPYIRGEYFGYFVQRLVCHFLNEPQSAEQSFGSSFFNESKKTTLRSSADHIGALMNRNDPLKSAGDLNYAISAVYWGFLGNSGLATTANYGLRAYLTGILDMVDKGIAVHVANNARDAAMANRRLLIARGVLNHVLIEEYRRNTSLYENDKVRENGDIWKDGQLVV